MDDMTRVRRAEAVLWFVGGAVAGVLTAAVVAAAAWRAGQFAGYLGFGGIGITALVAGQLALLLLPALYLRFAPSDRFEAGTNCMIIVNAAGGLGMAFVQFGTTDPGVIVMGWAGWVQALPAVAAAGLIALLLVVRSHMVNTPERLRQ